MEIMNKRKKIHNHRRVKRGPFYKNDIDKRDISDDDAKILSAVDKAADANRPPDLSEHHAQIGDTLQEGAEKTAAGWASGISSLGSSLGKAAGK